MGKGLQFTLCFVELWVQKLHCLPDRSGLTLNDLLGAIYLGHLVTGHLVDPLELSPDSGTLPAVHLSWHFSVLESICLLVYVFSVCSHPLECMLLDVEDCLLPCVPVSLHSCWYTEGTH